MKNAFTNIRQVGVQHQIKKLLSVFKLRLMQLLLP